MSTCTYLTLDNERIPKFYMSILRVNEYSSFKKGVIKMIVRRIFVACITILAFSCSEKDANHVIQVNMQNNGSEIGITLDDTLQVSLKGNYTTPFRWKVSKLDTTILKLVDTTYVQDQPVAPGSGGTAIFMFTAGGRGRSEIKLLSQDFFNIVADSFSIIVNVNSLPD